MAIFETAYKLLMQREFSNNSDYFLHQNKAENGLTIAGLYQKWNPKTIDWDFVERVLKMVKNDFKIASNMLIRDVKIQKQILQGFKTIYWDKYRLSEIVPQNTANELFISITNIGGVNAIKMAQGLVGVEADGIIGSKTIKALNEYDSFKFDKEFDLLEIENYKNIAKRNPNLAHNLKGWINRSVAV